MRSLGGRSGTVKYRCLYRAAAELHPSARISFVSNVLSLCMCSLLCKSAKSSRETGRCIIVIHYYYSYKREREREDIYTQLVYSVWYTQLVPATNVTHPFTFIALCFSDLSCLFHFLEVTLRDLLYFTVCFVLLIMNVASWTAGLLFLSGSTSRFQHKRLFIHHVRIWPLHIFKLFSSWIFTSRQPHAEREGS